MIIFQEYWIWDWNILTKTINFKKEISMNKTYILEDLDCAHCAAKIEEEVGKLEGVVKSTCTFLTQKLVLEIDDEKAKDITKQVKKIVKKLEPDVEVVEK